jgi:hypothetical protein
MVSRAPAADREVIAAIFNQPVSGQTATPAAVARYHDRFEAHLRLHTDILPD